MTRSFAVLLLSLCLVPAVAQDLLDPISVPGEAMQKLLIHSVRPVAPADSGIREEGTVVLDVVINKAGSIESLHTVSGKPVLVVAALDAVKQWKYRPYEVNGIARAVATTVRVEFPKENEEGTKGSEQQPQLPVTVSGEEMRGRLAYRVAPNYPPLARQARIQGMVILRIFINKLGEVRDTQLVSGHPMLAPAALDAVKKWRYMPCEADGQVFEIETEVQVIFKLAGG